MEYIVAVKTGDAFGAGTEAQVFMKIDGEGATTSDLHLEDSINGHRVHFVRDQSDIFSFRCNQSLGTLKSVTVWHDGSATGFANAWFLEGIQILDVHAGTRYIFPCKRWLAENKDDYQIRRELPCTVVKPWNPEKQSAEATQEGSLPLITPQEETLVEGKKNKKQKKAKAGKGGGRPGVVGYDAGAAGYGAGYGGGYPAGGMGYGMGPGAGYGGGYPAGGMGYGMGPGMGGGNNPAGGMGYGMTPGMGGGNPAGGMGYGSGGGMGYGMGPGMGGGTNPAGGMGYGSGGGMGYGMTPGMGGGTKPAGGMGYGMTPGMGGGKKGKKSSTGDEEWSW